MNVQYNPSENDFNETKNIMEGLGFKIKIYKTMIKTFCAPSIDYVVGMYKSLFSFPLICYFDF